MNVVQALVIVVIVIVIDKCTDLLLQIAWQVLVFRENVVFHGLVPVFDFALSLWTNGALRTCSIFFSSIHSARSAEM